MRISLDADDFRALVTGQVIRKTQTVDEPAGGWGQVASSHEVEVEIALQDIGIEVMIRALSGKPRREEFTHRFWYCLDCGDLEETPASGLACSCRGAGNVTDSQLTQAEFDEWQNYKAIHGKKSWLEFRLILIAREDER